LLARIEKGFLTSLKSKASSEEYITGFDIGKFDALQLVYGRNGGSGEQKFGKWKHKDLGPSGR
jgi:hypothetical protein